MKKRALFLFVAGLLVARSVVLWGDESAGAYSPLGKRDPFQIPKPVAREVASSETDLFRYTLEQFQLRAILKGGSKNQILIEDPNGKNYVLEEGSVLGRGKATVSRILDKEVILTERGVNYLGVQGLSEKVLSLSQDEENAEP